MRYASSWERTQTRSRRKLFAADIRRYAISACKYKPIQLSNKGLRAGDVITHGARAQLIRPNAWARGSRSVQVSQICT